MIPAGIPPVAEYFLPPDLDLAAEQLGAACGHGALAAALRCSVIDACQLFPQLSLQRRYVNIPDMRAALDHCPSIRWRTAGDWAFPRDGLALIQFTGSWTNPGVPPAAAAAHRHWVASRRGRIWDVNWPTWEPLALWSQVLPELYPKRCTGWRLQQTFELTPVSHP